MLGKVVVILLGISCLCMYGADPERYLLDEETAKLYLDKETARLLFSETNINSNDSPNSSSSISSPEDSSNSSSSDLSSEEESSSHCACNKHTRFILEKCSRLECEMRRIGYDSDLILNRFDIFERILTNFNLELREQKAILVHIMNAGNIEPAQIPKPPLIHTSAFKVFDSDSTSKSDSSCDDSLVKESDFLKYSLRPELPQKALKKTGNTTV